MAEENKNIGADDTSGYTDDLMKEVERGMETLSSPRFSDIAPVYTSRSGQARILTATRYGKRYALKALKEEFRYNPMYRLALQKEFELGLRMEHPNIVSTIGFEEVEELGPAIIMEYVDGETLEEFMERGEISARKARTITRQLADAIGYMHSKQVIHRDIKPSNIMIAHTGETVKLIDFSLSDSDTFTIIKAQAGTRSYMAPELNDPEAKSNVRTDLYSFGIIVHDLAVATSDRRLLEISRACTKKNPAERAASIADLNLPEITSGSDTPASLFSLDSPRLTYLLAALAAILTLLIAYLATTR